VQYKFADDDDDDDDDDVLLKKTLGRFKVQTGLNYGLNC